MRSIILRPNSMPNKKQAQPKYSNSLIILNLFGFIIAHRTLGFPNHIQICWLLRANSAFSISNLEFFFGAILEEGPCENQLVDVYLEKTKLLILILLQFRALSPFVVRSASR